MKRLASMFVMLLITFSALTGAFATEESLEPSIFTLVDAMSLDQLIELNEYVDEKISAEKAGSLNTTDDEVTVEATRDNPAFVGDRVVFEYGTGELAITVLYSFRGDAAALFAKSFNRYNTASYTMGKGTEWLLQYIKIECLSSLEERVDISDFYFHLISEAGVDLGYGYIADNPLPINSMYVGSTQYCWFGLFAPKDTKAFLSFDDTYSSSVVWYDLSRRRTVDTSALDYDELNKNAAGEIVDAMQMMLVEYGFLTKVPSGKFDSNTISALKKFQKAVGLKADGAASQETLRRLFNGEPVNTKH